MKLTTVGGFRQKYPEFSLSLRSLADWVSFSENSPIISFANVTNPLEIQY